MRSCIKVPSFAVKTHAEKVKVCRIDFAALGFVGVGGRKVNPVAPDVNAGFRASRINVFVDKRDAAALDDVAVFVKFRTVQAGLFLFAEFVFGVRPDVCVDEINVAPCFTTKLPLFSTGLEAYLLPSATPLDL